jgi:hypothetical protein
MGRRSHHVANAGQRSKGFMTLSALSLFLARERQPAQARPGSVQPSAGRVSTVAQGRDGYVANASDQRLFVTLSVDTAGPTLISR